MFAPKVHGRHFPAAHIDIDGKGLPANVRRRAGQTPWIGIWMQAGKRSLCLCWGHPSPDAVPKDRTADNGSARRTAWTCRRNSSNARKQSAAE